MEKFTLFRNSKRLKFQPKISYIDNKLSLSVGDSFKTFNFKANTVISVYIYTLYTSGTHVPVDIKFSVASY